MLILTNGLIYYEKLAEKTVVFLEKVFLFCFVKKLKAQPIRL